MMKSQTLKILKYVKSGKKIDPQKALKLFSCMRLAARVKQIADEHEIILKRKMIYTKHSRYMEYWL